MDNCKIVETMQTIDWVCLGILIVLGIWKIFDLIHASPKLAHGIIAWVESRHK